jgi:hypothetical protein
MLYHLNFIEIGRDYTGNVGKESTRQGSRTGKNIVNSCSDGKLRDMEFIAGVTAEFNV